MSNRTTNVVVIIVAIALAPLVFMLTRALIRMQDPKPAPAPERIKSFGAEDPREDVMGAEISDTQAPREPALRVSLSLDRAAKYRNRFQNRLAPLYALFRADREPGQADQVQEAAKVILEAEVRLDNRAKLAGGAPRARSDWDIYVLLWAASARNAVTDAKRPGIVDDSFVLNALAAHPDAAVRSADRLPKSLHDAANKLLQLTAENSWRRGSSADRWRLIGALAERPRPTESGLTGWAIKYWAQTNRKDVGPAQHFHALVELWRSADDLARNDLTGADRTLAQQDVADAFIRRRAEAADAEAVHEAIALAAAIEQTKSRFGTTTLGPAGGNTMTADQALAEFASQLSSDELADALRDTSQVTRDWQSARGGLAMFADRWIKVREKAGDSVDGRVRLLLHWRRRPDDVATIPSAVAMHGDTASRDADQADAETFSSRSYIDWLRDLDLDEEPQVPRGLSTATGPFQGASEDLIRRYSVACRHPDSALTRDVLDRLHWQGSGFTMEKEKPYAAFASDIEKWSTEPRMNGRDWIRGPGTTSSRDRSPDRAAADRRVLLTLLLLGRDEPRYAGVGRSAPPTGADPQNTFLARAVMSCRVDRPEWRAAVERWARRGRTPQQAAGLCGFDVGGKRPEGN